MLTSSDPSLFPMLPIEGNGDFRCPGESQPISRSVHLARLAAGSTACRECPHREEQGSLPRHISRRLSTTAIQPVPELISRDGLRGIYLNQLTREKLAGIVEHVLDLIDEQRMSTTATAAESRGPLRILVGYDFRPSSPDLAIGVVAALRRWGCEIGDLGSTTRPAFAFATERLRPHAALYLTGGILPPAWTGLDLLDRQAIPWCFPGELQRLQSRLARQPARTVRTQGTCQPLRLQGEYESTLSEHFHAIRPLRLLISCVDPLVRDLLQRLLVRTPCSITLSSAVVGPSGSRSERDFADEICSRYADAGLVIGSDGRACRLFDERGDEMSVPELLRLLVRGLPPQLVARGAVLLTRDDEVAEENPDEEVPIQVLTGTEADLIAKLQGESLPLAADLQGRFWFLHETPRCDAIETLGALLQTMSLSERPLSAYRLVRKKRLKARKVLPG
ncbi:hypothetical protein [Planctomicrobium sp. SH664]|uniref:hypothetical protein n=1 Tax=Planctomicrobium sp. SH664 TaxID=3448125 RepID=UPI003F5C489C